MNTYFKFTIGDAFELSGEDYVGFFNVVDGVPYTGKGNDPNSVELTPKQTFITEFYLKELDFAYDEFNLPELEYEQITRMDILDKDKLEKMLSVFNNNNLKLYSYLFRPSTQNLTATTENTFYYGLSSTPKDTRNDDRPTGKNVYSHIDPFSHYPALSALDDARPLNLLVRDDKTFYYVCASDTQQIALTGSFEDPQLELTIVGLDEGVELIDAFYDGQSDYLVLHENGEVLVYDYSNFYSCNTTALIDRFDVPVNTRLGMGNVYRVHVDGVILSIYQKYNNILVYQYDLSQILEGNVVSFDVRDSDDAIIIIDDKNYIYTSNLDSFIESLITTKLDDDDPLVSQIVVYIKFYKLDSNVFEVRVQQESNFAIRYRYVNNPKIQMPILTSNESLYYLDDYIYSEVFEKYNKLDVKYNSNDMPSNSYNNRGIIENISADGEDFFRLTHNVGRLYITTDKLHRSVSSATSAVIKNYQNSVTCEKSGLGLSMNIEVKKLLDDVLTLYRLCVAIPVYSNSGIHYKEVPEFEFELLNSKLAENESLNVDTLNRIFFSIYNLQKQFLE